MSLTVPSLGIIIPNMGIPDGVGHSPLEALLTPVQARLLGLVFSQPQRRFQGSELIREAGSGVGGTHRQLKRLTEAGLFTLVPMGSQKFYQANRKSPIFGELHSLILKTVGLAQPLRDALSPVADRVKAAFVYGSIAAGNARAESDVDLMVISDNLDYASVFELLQPVEQLLARKINPTVMPSVDWTRKREMPDSFASRIATGPKIWVIGDDAAIS